MLHRQATHTRALWSLNLRVNNRQYPMDMRLVGPQN